MERLVRLGMEPDEPRRTTCLSAQMKSLWRMSPINVCSVKRDLEDYEGSQALSGLRPLNLLRNHPRTGYAGRSFLIGMSTRCLQPLRDTGRAGIDDDAGPGAPPYSRIRFVVTVFCFLPLIWT